MANTLTKGKGKVIHLCENNKGIFRNMPFIGKVFSPDREGKAWKRFREYTRPIKGLSKTPICIVDDRDCLPDYPYEIALDIQAVEQSKPRAIARELVNIAYAEARRKNSSNEFLEKTLFFIILLEFGLVAILILLGIAQRYLGG